MLLKRGPNRSVLREEVRDGEPARDAGAVRIVKRFHRQGPARFADRRRARREKNVLDRLRELGLPAPRTGDVARELDGAWVLAMDCVGERTLARILAETSGRMERALALALGELVAAFLAAGALHSDPHPANVVIDARGRPWIVDGGGVRFSVVPRAGAVVAQLAAMTATVRELVPARARARIFAEVWRRLPQHLRGDPAQRVELVREIEARARARRLKSVLANLDRWTRESGVCVAAPGIESSSRSESTAPRALLRRDGPTDLVGTELFVVAGDRAQAAWRTAARLHEHGLPVTPPLRFELPPHARAVFELDARARPLDATLGTLPRESVASLARRVGRLLGAFHDRGLRLVLVSSDDLRVSPSLELVVSPLARVDDRTASAADRLSALALAPGLRELEGDPHLRRLLRASYAEAFGEAAERRAIQAELSRG